MGISDTWDAPSYTQNTLLPSNTGIWTKFLASRPGDLGTANSKQQRLRSQTSWTRFWTTKCSTHCLTLVTWNECSTKATVYRKLTSQAPSDLSRGSLRPRMLVHTNPVPCHHVQARQHIINRCVVSLVRQLGMHTPHGLATHHQQGIMMPVYADAYAPSQARKRAHEAACSPASAVSSAAPYKVYRGQARRIRLVGPALLHIQPQLLNIFGFVPATCSALPGHCTCTPGGLRCSAPLPPATVAFDSPQLGDEELVYILATLQHRQRAMLDPDYDQRRPLPDGYVVFW